MSQPAAAPELVSDMVCTCVDHCSKDYICSVNEQPFTTVCECRGSLGKGDICPNLFTMLAGISVDDPVEDDISI